MGARIWAYWLTVPALAYRQLGSARLEAYLDPPADAFAEIALTSHQTGYASTAIINVNDSWGFSDWFRFQDRLWRVTATLKAVGGPSIGSINNTGARLIVREYEGGKSYPRQYPEQSMRSIVYDSKTGNVLHIEEVFGSAEKLSEFSGGKLEERAHDFVRTELGRKTGFDVMPAPAGTLQLGNGFKVDVKKKVLVPVKVKAARPRKT